MNIERINEPSHPPPPQTDPRQETTPEPIQPEEEPQEPQTMMMECTAYSYTGSRTATGTWPSRGTIAADWSVLPPGTRLQIEGYGEGVVLDRGGAIRGDRLDLYMSSRSEALQWGRRTVEVTILLEVPDAYNPANIQPNEHMHSEPAD